MLRQLRSALVRALVACGAALALLPPAVEAAPRCTFLKPIGGDGSSPIVSKRVSRGKLIGNTNWNTDFIVDRSYDFYKFFFTANSSDPAAQYPVSGYMKFTDGSSLKLFEQRMSPPVGTGKMFGPYRRIPGKQAGQMNFKIGSSDDLEAMGFSYRISVQGCTF